MGKTTENDTIAGKIRRDRNVSQETIYTENTTSKKRKTGKKNHVSVH